MVPVHSCLQNHSFSHAGGDFVTKGKDKCKVTSMEHPGFQSSRAGKSKGNRETDGVLSVEVQVA